MGKVLDVLDVFGVSNDLVESYIEREEVDGDFQRAISLGKQIIVYGSSKQGKTSLIKKHLKEDSIIQIECSPSMELIDIYSSILRQSKVDIVSEYSDIKKSSSEFAPAINAKIKIPLIAEVGGGIGTNHSTSKSSDLKYKTVNYNLSIAQDILEILKEIKFNKIIVLENFHYLREEVQKLFSFDLRTFQDGNIRFIIVGIWRERNRLGQFNGDLQDRMIEVAVEPWKAEDFYKVIKIGAKKLNVSFENVKKEIIESCFDSIGVLQELCKECCFGAKIKQTSKNQMKITKANLRYAKNRKLVDYSSRHIRSFESFIESSKKEREGKIPLFIPYYFIKILIASDFNKISDGFKRKYIHEEIMKIHHRSNEVRAGDMSNFLYPIVKYQILKDIKPPIFDYDQSIQTLRIIDSTLYFFLRECNHKEVLENLLPPSEKLPLKKAKN